MSTTSIQDQTLIQSTYDTATTDVGSLDETSTSTIADNFASMMESAVTSQEEDVTTATQEASTSVDQYSVYGAVDDAITEDGDTSIQSVGDEQSTLDATLASMEEQATTTE